MKLGVFTVMLPEWTPEEAAAELGRAGYQGVEWRVTHDAGGGASFWKGNRCTLEPTRENAERAKRLAQENGLTIPNLGTYINLGDMEAVKTAMQFAKKAGSPQLRVGVGQWRGNYREQEAAAKAFLHDVVEVAKDFGLKALIELHHGTIVPSSAHALRLIEGLEPNHIGVIYDPGNMVHEGQEDYLLGAELLGPYLAHVHLKNAAYDRPEGGGVWKARWAPFEDGVVDFARLFSVLAQVGYDGWLVTEDFSGVRQGREMLTHNLTFIKNKMAEAGVA
jgi:sugar phosphate isomerase/epimerase